MSSSRTRGLVPRNPTFATLNVSGNVGIGGVPSGWHPTLKAVEFASGAIWSQDDGDALRLTNNSYLDVGVAFRYKETNTATRYDLSGGGHTWYYAASGTAGDTVTWTQGMALSSSGLAVTGSIRPSSYTVGTLPAVGTAGGMIYVSDEAGGATPAFSDGTNWRRTADRAIVS